MEIFRDNLMRAREVIALVKERERIKRQVVLMSGLGKFTAFLSVDFDSQTGNHASINSGPALEEIKKIEEMLRSQKTREARSNINHKIKPDTQVGIPVKPQIPRVDEQPIVIENSKIVCNLEFACILSSLTQKAVNAVLF